MTRLLGLDIATVTGWSFGDTEVGDPVSGVKKLPSTGAELGPFLLPFEAWLTEMINTREPEQIVFEEPILPRMNTQLSTTLKLHSLIGLTELIAMRHRISITQVAAGSWKKGFTGQGNASKKMVPYPVVRRCHELGWEHIKDHNEADALGLWVYAARFFSPAAVARFDPLARQGSLFGGVHA
jgi:Holliday junction resolvasome RuvABC endonuclease subunit